ncbi:hypothetical protein ACFQS1_36930 [Paractinoplanes rhizophilus]|uniref:Uncharacterized protein n=1 Tax=Paractinoplanes rhizophilus TaxID=1416877 RepID=A0ABW2I3W7_9ACTN
MAPAIAAAMPHRQPDRAGDDEDDQHDHVAAERGAGLDEQGAGGEARRLLGVAAPIARVGLDADSPCDGVHIGCADADRVVPPGMRGEPGRLRAGEEHLRRPGVDGRAYPIGLERPGDHQLETVARRGAEPDVGHHLVVGLRRGDRRPADLVVGVRCGRRRAAREGVHVEGMTDRRG